MSNPSQQAPQELPVAPAQQQVAPAQQQVAPAQQQVAPTPPIYGAPAPQVNEPPVPQVNIPHMGTSQATVPQAQAQPQTQPQVQQQVLPPAQAQVLPPAQAQAQPQPQPQAQAVLHMPPLPEGVSQEDVNTAIAHVEQTGHADGIAPQILAAACQQIEARAVHQGIDLQQAGQAPQEQPEQQAGPANYVEAAVMDKKGTIENFHNQRDSLRSAVTEQRESAQRTYSDALDKSNNPTGDDATGQANAEAMKALAAELKALDPQTIALINAMGVLSNTPEVMKSILWMEIVRAMRNLISSETKQQVKACMGDDAAA